MRRLTLVLVVATACRAATPAPAGGALTGADSPRAALDQFLAAARAQDIQALSVVWGDESGPARNKFARQELERRELIMVSCLKYDQTRISAPSVAEGGRQAFQVELKQAQLTATPRFTAARGPSNRWYVQDFEVQVLQNAGFCKRA